jgi:hypothetical protein
MLMYLLIVDDLVMMMILSIHRVRVCTLPSVFPWRGVVVL